MHLITRHTFAILGFLAAGAAHAATDCANATRQADMNACAGEEYSKADASLNKVYGQLMQKLPAARKEGLRNVQKAWLRYRDLDCGFAADAYAGGSMQPMVKAGCLTTLTNARTKRLQDMLEEVSR